MIEHEIRIICNYFFVILIILINVVNGQRVCDDLEWKCKDGQCILSEENCDGIVNCNDGSDETAETCLYMHCPSYAFRCAYGACVSGKAECNGIQECADNSDETSIACPGILQSIQLNGNCSEEYFQCESGECIPSDNVCDGRKNCQDTSDETVKICSRNNCPSFAFRCGYGACVDGTAKCDGIVDCVDGSDESILLCGINHTTEKNTVVVPTRPVRPVVLHGGCYIEDIPNVLFTYEANGETISTGTYAPDNSQIKYKCRPQHILDGPDENICLNKAWFVKTHPKCTKRCSNIALQGVTFKASCEYERREVSCTDPIRPNTRAYIRCEIGYEKPETQPSNVIVCQENGKWDSLPYKCKAVCGLEPIGGIPFVAGGQTADITQIPWLVAIYEKMRDDKYSHVCGGTIISQRIVISAAHCFWDIVKEVQKPKELYKIGAAKYLRDFYAKEPQTQIFDIHILQIHEGYRDIHLSYYNDIAVVVLDNNIRFNAFVKPICIDFKNSTIERRVKPDTLGRVGGWGKTVDGNPSNDIRVIDLPTIGPDRCKAEAPQDYLNLVTNDKFCVSNVNGETVCRGDSGGGFVIPEKINGVNVYYLWGVVSVGLTQKDICGGDYITTFTNIQFHQRFILDYEIQFRPKS